MNEQEKQVKLVESAIKELMILIPLIKSGQATIKMIAISIEETNKKNN